MANYVYNKIICSKEVLNKYFHDDNQFEDEKFNEKNPEPESNFWIWKYDFENQEGWEIWKCNDFIKRYFKNYPAQLYYEKMKKEN